MIKPIPVTTTVVPPVPISAVLRPRLLRSVLDSSVGLFLILSLGQMVASRPLLAATPPTNDACDNSLVIPRNGPFPYTTPVVDVGGATTSTNDPVPANPFLANGVTRSVWYQFTPGASGMYMLSTCSDAGAATTINDTVLGVYTSSRGCIGPFTQVGNLGDEDCGASGSQAAVSLPLSADTTYYIVVWKFCDACVEDGLNALQLVVSGSVVAPNDICAGVLPILLNVPVLGTTVGASDNLELSGTNGFGGLDQVPSAAQGRDVVYAFTAPAAGEYSFKDLAYAVSQDLVNYDLTNWRVA